MSRKIRILVVDDSAVIRSLLQKIFSLDPDLEVVGVATDPFMARELLVQLQPDVMTLDIEMPRMDGLTFLSKVMVHRPTPTVIVSSLSQAGSQESFRAYELGAVEVIAKPTMDISKSLTELGQDLIAAVKAAAQAKLQPLRPHLSIAKSQQTSAMNRTTHQILAMAASTGGTEAVKTVLSALPADSPGILIVQHIPPGFSRSFAQALDKICAFEIKEAEDGDRVHPGRALVAPGNFHMQLSRSGAYYYVQLDQGPSEHGVRPAADVLMRSVAQVAGANAMGVVLTGMGKDGAKGLLAMKQAGAYNIGQDETTSVVYGMPREAFVIGALDVVLPLTEIAGELRRQFRQREVSGTSKVG